MENNQILLQRFFARLNDYISVAPALRESVEQQLTIRPIPKEKVLSGYIGDLHFVLDGLVLKLDEYDNILEFLPAGEFIFHVDAEQHARFVCKENTVVATLTQDDILSILKTHVEFYLYINKIFNSVLAKGQLRAKLLDKPIAQRKKIFYRMFPDVAATRPMYEIASYLGCNVNYFGSV